MYRLLGPHRATNEKAFQRFVHSEISGRTGVPACSLLRYRPDTQECLSYFPTRKKRKRRGAFAPRLLKRSRDCPPGKPTRLAVGLELEVFYFKADCIKP